MRLETARRGRELLPCARRVLACSHLPVSLLCVTSRVVAAAPGRVLAGPEHRPRREGSARYESPLLSSTAAPETLAQHHRPASPAAARHPPTSTPTPDSAASLIQSALHVELIFIRPLFAPLTTSHAIESPTLITLGIPETWLRGNCTNKR